MPNGLYNVTFHFVELYYAAPCAGKRIFSMDIADTTANPDIANLDICAAAGGPNAALIRTINGVNVSDGVLNIRSIYGSADDPEIAAIEVTPAIDTTAAAAAAIGDGYNANRRRDWRLAFGDRGELLSDDGSDDHHESSFTLKNSATGASVAANVSYDGGSSTATLTPNTALASNTQYTARLDSTIKASDGTAAPGRLFVGVHHELTRRPSGSPNQHRRPAVHELRRQHLPGGSVLHRRIDAQGENAITGTTDQALYQNERWGNFSYAIPVTNGTYDVKLHFVELYYGTSAPGGNGKRVFGIDVLDTPTSPDLSNIDIYSQVGANAALVKTIAGVTVTDGVLNLKSVYGTADDPEIAAIEVVPSTGPPPPPPPPPPGPDQVGQWSAPISWPGQFTCRYCQPGTSSRGTASRQPRTPSRFRTPRRRTSFPSRMDAISSPPVTCCWRMGGRSSPEGTLGRRRPADTTVFDSSTNTWTREPDMTVGRWYPTATELADGRVLVFSGDNIIQNRSNQPPPLTDASVNSLPEIYDPVSNAWTDLTGSKLTSPLYPFMFALSQRQGARCRPGHSPRARSIPKQAPGRRSAQVRSTE